MYGKPQNKTGLLRYLEANPWLEFAHPRGINNGRRKFLRTQGGSFVFEIVGGPKDGTESFLTIPPAATIGYTSDGFTIPTGFGDMRYTYAGPPVVEVVVPPPPVVVVNVVARERKRPESMS